MSTVKRAAAHLLFACFCALLTSAQAAGDPEGPIHPGDDFFGYANAAWLSANPIPQGQTRWSARNEISALTARQLTALLDEAAASPAGSPARSVADFRAAYLDQATIERRGLAPVEESLRSIDRLRDKADLSRWLGRELPADVDPITAGIYDSAHVLGFSLQSGIHGESVYVAYLVQGGLGLSDREAYLKDDAESRAQRDGRQAAIAHILGALGVPGSETARRAAAVMGLETGLARSHATREQSAMEHNADTLWRQADFMREAPGMDWPAFFRAAGLTHQAALVPWQPGAVKGAAALVATQPLGTWQDYLRVRVVDRLADVLPRAMSAAPLPHESRPQRALEATQKAMKGAIGRLYVARHFPPEQKARVRVIADQVIASCRRHVQTASWLSPQARMTALAKLKTLYFGIGYPERWPDDEGTTIAPDDAAGNLQRIARHERRQALARIGRPVERSAWTIPSQWPGAVLNFNDNSYNFAAALLQPPKYDATASDAASYGAIGAIIGHEVSHFVDTLGADYEPDGRMRRWWSAEDLALYESASAPLIRQFSDYRPFPDVAVDGKRGLVENFADLAGLTAAFDAHRLALGARVADAEFVRQQDREFFIGFAHSWRIKYGDDALKAQARSDHSPETYRVWTVRNLDAWYEAFDVRPGHRLYLEPAARVKLW